MSGSIATRLIIVLTLCSVLILGLGLGLDYRLSRQEVLAALASESQETINAAVIDLDNLLDGVEATTGLLGKILQQREYSQEGLAQMLRDALENNEDIFGGTIALAPAPGELGPGYAPYYHKDDAGLAFTDLAGVDKPYWANPWFEDPLAQRRPVWSEPYFDKGGGEAWMTTYSVPVYRVDEAGQPFPYAVVTGDITLRELRDYLQRLQPGKDGFAVLLSRRGMVLSSLQDDNAPRATRSVVGHEVDPQEWQAALQAMDAGQVISRDLPCPHRGGRCTLRMRALQSTGWPVGVMFSEEEILAPLRAFEIKTGAIGLATLLVMALAVFVVTRRMTGPITALAQASHEIARGELNAPLPRARGKDEVAQLVRSFSAMKDDLKTYISDLESVTASRSRLEGELTAATEIQMAMLPGGGQAYESWPEASLWAGVRPAKSVGGDLYTYRRRGQRLFFAVGDVSDKGVPAALFMAKSIGLVQQLVDESGEPAQMLASLNDALEQGNDNCMFVTMFLGVLDLDSLELRFSSAGHSAPALLRSGDVDFPPQDSGPALGLSSGLTYPCNRLKLQAGDRLALFTDGIDEAFDTHERMFGLEGIVASLSASASESVASAGSALIADVDKHCGDAAQSDDITLLLLDLATADGAGSGCGAGQVEVEAVKGISAQGLAWIREALSGSTIPSADAMEIELVAEEIITNIDKYAQLAPTDRVAISVQWSPDRVTLEVRDPGEPFDPLLDSQRSARGRSIDSAAIGGLGVHLITQLTDSQGYRREAEQNVLRVVRNISQDLSRGTGYQPGELANMDLTTTVSLDKENSVARVALDGALNTETAPAFEKRLQAVVDEGHRLIVLDMKDLEYISSAGLRVIFKAAKQMGSEGRKLAAANRKPHIDKVFEILKALPDMAVFANDEELDDYLGAMQAKVRDGD